MSNICWGDLGGIPADGRNIGSIEGSFQIIPGGRLCFRLFAEVVCYDVGLGRWWLERENSEFAEREELQWFVAWTLLKALQY